MECYHQRGKLEYQHRQLHHPLHRRRHCQIKRRIILIDQIVQEINTALEHDCYLIALASALILPDICGQVEYPNESTTSRYKKWYSKYIGQYERYEECDEPGEEAPYPSADIVYNLRNSLLHCGNPNVDQTKRNLTDFHLIVTKDSFFGSISSKNLYGTERTLDIGIRNLCMKLCVTAQLFYQENKDKFHFDYEVIQQNS